MSEMTPERWQAIELHFDRLSRLGPDAQQQQLEQLRSESPSVHAEVASLLEQENTLVKRGLTTVIPPPSTTNDQALMFTPGHQVNEYTLLFPVAQNPSSEVWCGHRTPRPHADALNGDRIAIKFLRTQSGKFSENKVQRFATEAEILAQLNHPYIAQLIATGRTPEKDLFIAMEWIDGIPLTDYCDQKQLDIRQRVTMLCKVMEAISFAHQHFVVHRDIKPENILVTNDGTPFVLDFGISKVLSDGEPDATLVEPTVDCSMTPAFASPEQVKANAVSTSTDIYSLGLLTYLVLSGHHAYSDTAQPEHTLLFDRICFGMPRKMSEIVSKDSVPLESVDSQNFHLLAGLRKSTPKQLKRRLRGQLDCIVHHALQKDASHRYETVLQFKQDLGCWLENRPIQARQPGFSLRRWTQQNPIAALLVAVATTFTLMSVAASSLWIALSQSQDAVVDLESKLADQQAIVTQILGLHETSPEPGNVRVQIALCTRHADENRIDSAVRILDDLVHQVDTRQLSRTTRIALGQACLRTGKITLGLTTLQRELKMGAEGFADDSAADDFRMRRTISRLLIEAGWLQLGKKWAESMTPTQPLHTVQQSLTLARTYGELGQVQDARTQLESVRNSLELDRLDAISLGEIQFIEQVINIDEDSPLMDSNETDTKIGFQPIWRARLYSNSSALSKDPRQAQLALQKALRIVDESQFNHHPITISLIAALAELSRQNSEAANTDTETAAWVQRGWVRGQKSGEIAACAMFDLATLRLQQMSPENEQSTAQEVFKELATFRFLNQQRPFSEVDLLDFETNWQLNAGRKQRAKTSAKEYIRLRTEISALNNPAEIAYGKGMLAFAESRELSPACLKSIAGLLETENRIHRVCLQMALDFKVHRTLPAYRWLDFYVNNRYSKDPEFVHSIVYFAECHLLGDRQAAATLGIHLLKHVEHVPFNRKSRVLSLLSAAGEIDLIRKDLESMINNADAPISDRDQASATLINGLAKNADFDSANQVAERCKKILLGATPSLNASIWNIEKRLEREGKLQEAKRWRFD